MNAINTRNINWKCEGSSYMGDEYGPIVIYSATVNGVRVTRSRRRGTRTGTEYMVGRNLYRNLTDAIASIAD
jgi:hypothetical protein